MATALIERADAAQLRRSIYDKGAATRTDLVGLLTLGPEYNDDGEFLTLVRDVARDTCPADLDEDAADALVARLGDGAGLASRAEFEALKSVLRHAASVPSSLVAFAVREIERAILTGRRSAIGGLDSESAFVGAGDVQALREVCPLRVDRATAEALFDIAHATASARNDSAFDSFFAKTIGAYLIAATSAVAPKGDTLSALVDAPFSVGAAGQKSAERLAEDSYRAESAETEARLDAAAQLDVGEAKWALVHLARGGELSEAEQRLIAFLRARAVVAPPTPPPEAARKA